MHDVRNLGALAVDFENLDMPIMMLLCSFAHKGKLNSILCNFDAIGG